MGWSSAVEVVREYVVNGEAGGHFELQYGPGGAWSRLFAHCPGFRGITVLRDMKNRQRYLVIEIWESETLREQALREQALRELATAYADLEAAQDEWLEVHSELGLFSMVSEATVRARSRAGRGRAPSGRRSGRPPG